MLIWCNCIVPACNYQAQMRSLHILHIKMLQENLRVIPLKKKKKTVFPLDINLLEKYVIDEFTRPTLYILLGACLDHLQKT